MTNDDETRSVTDSMIPCATCGLLARPQWLTLGSYDGGERDRTSTIAFYLCQNDHITNPDGSARN